MRCITASSVVVLAFVASGCIGSNEDVALEPMYFVLVGDSSGYFDNVKVGEAIGGDDQFLRSPSVGAANEHFTASILADGRLASRVDGYAVQHPIGDHSISKISVVSNSNVLYVYITKHIDYDDPETHRIICTYKKRIESSEGKARIDIDLAEVIK